MSDEYRDLLRVIGDDVKRIERRIYGNGTGERGVIERLITLENNVESLAAVPKIKGVPVKDAIIIALLVINLVMGILLGGASGAVDVNELGRTAAGAAAEMTPGQ